MTHDLWLVLILLVVAVSLAAHNHRLADSELPISDARYHAGEASDR